MTIDLIITINFIISIIINKLKHIIYKCVFIDNIWIKLIDERSAHARHTNRSNVRAPQDPFLIYSTHFLNAYCKHIYNYFYPKIALSF